ncbi:MAG UNVERIFIED_CONTAM: helix-turn-helix domain-containing protein [Thermobifida fusca]
MTTTPPEGAPRRLRQLPEAVTYAREQAGLKQVELARRVGISYQLMSDIERGYRSATDETLNRLAAALNCPRVMLEAKREVTTG